MDEKNVNEGKKKASKKELLMIVVVVVLAFGLTVAGIVYLTGFLMGGDSKPAKTEAPISKPQPPAEDDVLRFSIDNDTTEADNDSIDIIEAPATPAPAPVAPAKPVPAPTPTPPAKVTPPAQQPAPAPAAKPAPVAPKAEGIPTTSPTKGKFQLQLFALQNQNRANTEAMKYIKDYPDLYIMKADLGDKGVWYRVRCCSTNTREEANAMKAAIEKKYNIVPDIVKGE